MATKEVVVTEQTLRDRKLTDEEAWAKASGQWLAPRLAGYPDKFVDLEEHMVEGFETMREGWLWEDKKAAVPIKMRAIYESLSEMEQDLLEPYFRLIRDLFNVPSPGERKLRVDRPSTSSRRLEV